MVPFSTVEEIILFNKWFNLSHQADMDMKMNIRSGTEMIYVASSNAMQNRG